jgi:putative ABC transport system permease protein
MIRTKTDPASLSSAVRGATSSVDHDQAVFMVRTMDQMYSDSVAQRRFSLVLLVAFAALALVLGTVGIYGVMAYVVAQRTHEIGIRVALGAQRQDVLRLILGQGFSLTLAGTALGIGGALLVTRFLSELLFEVSATDLATFAQVPLFLASVALLACYIPAWRAMRVDPMAALRYE